jgi:hypothetical protein
VEAFATAGLLSVTVAALGLLATALFRLEGKVEAGFAGLEARFDGRISQLEAWFDRRIDALEARLDARIEQLDAKLTEHLGHHPDLTNRSPRAGRTAQ